MRAALPWLAPLVLVPVVLLGLWLWRSAGPMIWLAGFIAACF